MGRKYFLTVVLCVFGLIGCDTDDLTSSGSGHNSRAIAKVELAEAESGAITKGEDNESDATVAGTESPSVNGGDASPDTEPPASVGKANCGAGHYAFRTDADGKFHFDAQFEPGGVVRYNFTVQPNRGNWRISGNQMIFNGPFGAGHSNHVSSWTITSRSSDCKVQRFQGKSFGGSDVTASRR